MDKAVFADRSDRGKLRVTGPQAAWFLDQVLTQSFEDMQPFEARDAAMITVHGRMTAYVEALMTDEAILCHYEPELRESLPEALGRYIFATEVELADVGDDMGLVLVAGDGWERAAKAAAPDATVHSTQSLGIDAVYLWVGRSDVQGVTMRLEAEGLSAASEPELDAVRIAHGIPRWGREMDEKTFPQEAGADVRAVHYEKGCYLGQEAMAKIHFRGKVNRRLVRLEGEGPLREGAEITLGGAAVGRVTSAADGNALGIVKRTVERGARVEAGAVAATIVD